MYLYLSCLNTVKYMYWNTRFDFKQLDLPVLLFFIVDFLLVLRGHSVFSSRATTANDLRLWRIFYPRFYPLLFYPIVILEKKPVFPFFNAECQTTTGTIFVTSLVWCSPWLGIEPGTSSTRCQHSTTRLSRRLCNWC